MSNIPVFKPLIEADEIGAAVESLEMGWLGMGSYVDQLERALSDHLGLEDKKLALVNTGHSALHLAILLAGIGPGDEVITPSFNCVSDFQAILQAGAEPVLCDIRDDSLTIDVQSAEKLVGKRTKAVLFIDYASSLADYEAVEKFAGKHGLRVIHDAAHSFNSTDKGRKVGSFSDLCMMSFDPVKTLTCLDAGGAQGGAEIVAQFGRHPHHEDEGRDVLKVDFGQADIGYPGQPLEIVGAGGLPCFGDMVDLLQLLQADCRV